jgi:hypothetical protein
VPKDEVGFTNHVAAAFRKALPKYRVRVHAALVLDVAGADGRNELDLDNTYKFCLRRPDECEDAIATQVQQISATLLRAAGTPERDKLRLIVRPEAFVQTVRQNPGGKGEPVAMPLQAGLWAVAVFDRPDTEQLVTPKDLAALGLTRKAALEIARSNVAAALPPLDAVTQPLEPGGIGTIADGPYEASRFLLPESWTALAQSWGGALMIAMPTTDVLLYARPKDAGSVEDLATLARIAGRKATPLSTTLFRWTSSGWQAIAR